VGVARAAFTAIGTPGTPLPVVQGIDIALWTLMGAVVLTVAVHHLRGGLRALTHRDDRTDNLAGATSCAGH
jgi:hypothetical protein